VRKRAAVFLALTILSTSQVAGLQTPSPKESTSPNPQMSMGSLAIASDTEGMLFVDGERKVAVSPGKIATLKLTAGQHFVDLRDGKGTKLWEKVVEVPVRAQVAERIQLMRQAETARPNPPFATGTEQPAPAVATDLGTNHDILCALKRYKEAGGPPPSSPWYQAGCPDGMSHAQLQTLANGIEESKEKVCTWGSMAKSPACVRPESLAHDLYVLGKHDEALGYANQAVGLVEWSISQSARSSEVDNPQPGSYDYTQQVFLKNDYRSASQVYTLRGLIRHALLDEDGALKDFDEATKLSEKFVKAHDPMGNVESQKVDATTFSWAMSDLHIYRAIVLGSVHRYSEAMSEINEPMFLGVEDTATSVRNAVKTAMGGSPDIVRSSIPTAPVPQGSNNGIANQIDEIVKSGRFSALPQAQASTSGGRGQPGLSIENRTAYELTVLVAGPVERSITVPAGGYENVILPAGNYRVVGKVSAPNVVPFFGAQSYADGISYRESFYIQ